MKKMNYTALGMKLLYMNKYLQGIDQTKGQGEGPRTIQVRNPFIKSGQGQRIHAKAKQDSYGFVCAWQVFQLGVEVFSPDEKVIFETVWLSHGQETWIELCGCQNTYNCHANSKF